MSVTQDYKIANLSAGEKLAIQFALEAREHEMAYRLRLREDDENHVRACTSLLAATQSALAKVRA
ncbi:hypothetical protein [Duganella sp. BuS-21]|uniref:hypothetical protein n=1 Tax=Duganella sp. BuS-21 TaxID=2943848 RepID=UPI0035A5C8B8